MYYNPWAAVILDEELLPSHPVSVTVQAITKQIKPPRHNFKAPTPKFYFTVNDTNFRIPVQYED
jgi:hypothetical protein